MVNYLKKHWITIFIFVLFFVIPYICFPVTIAPDYKFHTNRIASICENIKNGCFFSKIYYSNLDGYGYATPLFYGDLFLYPFAILILIGVPNAVILRLIVFSIYILCFVCSRCFAKKVFKKEESRMLFCLLYVFSSYLAFNVTFSFDVGQSYAISLLPLVATGFYSITFGDKKDWYYLPIGLSLCIYNHLLTTVTATIVMIVIFLLNISFYIKDKIRFVYLLVSAFIFFGLSATYLFPMLEQLLVGSFLCTNGQSANRLGPLSLRAQQTLFVFCDFVSQLYKFIFGEERPYSEVTPSGTGLFPIITIIFIILTKKINRKTIKCYAYGMIFLYMCSMKFPWDLFQEYCGILQFPTRLLTYPIFFFALGASFFAENNINKKIYNLYFTLIVIFTCVTLLSSNLLRYKTMYNELINNEYDYKWEFNDAIGTGEYLNSVLNENGEQLDYLEIKKLYLNNGFSVNSNQLSDESIACINNYSELNISINSNINKETYIDLPRIMYKGYSAYNSETGDSLKIEENENGLIRVYLEEDSHNILVKYDGTIVQKVSAGITTITLSFMIFLLMRNKNKNKTHDGARHGQFGLKTT